MNLDKQRNLYWNHFIAGLIGGFISVTVCHPLEVARSRLNLQNATKSVNKYSGFLNTLYVIFKEEGFSGYYKGYRATAIANPLFHSLFFPLYKWNKEILEIKYKIYGFYNHAAATVLTGFLCDLITNPLWVYFQFKCKQLIRTRMQTQYLHDHNNAKYKSVFGGLLTMYKEVYFKLLILGRILCIIQGVWVLQFQGCLTLLIQFPIL
ncbi:unnamed protein product (macronuclear) [Paramecium tetraurelia]|uniref:Mitochondrial carrier protein n=1 Tax=Paramecium tetraurelia TaxID=5888 RepID=A0C546_PARTE|nr:uncharacterized protein GSPATT00006412001 [Paramecium tetraurelia]CAK65913.1 unnamed protein product [Paramecium tetraurelia]|eukprot:XP_001433310.1 hypothetical protein (macronuclear) [Paramecium tetraurelia strain d4-2]